MKRKERLVPEDERMDSNDKSTAAAAEPEGSGTAGGEKFFLIEDGKLKPFSPQEYTASTVYQMVELYGVERKFVRPEDSNSIVYEGKRPSKKTVPIILTNHEELVMLSSWEELDGSPQQLADAREVIGAAPVKQVFILRKK